MAKKPRSQRRKKGNALREQLPSARQEVVDVDVLSEDHTVDETLASFDDEFDNEDEEKNWDVDDILSVASDGSTTVKAAASQRHTKLMEVLSMARELPGEKRSARRESSLRRLFRGLTQYAAGPAAMETVHHYREDIVAACINGLRPGGSPAEQYASCRVLEALGICLGSDQDQHGEEIGPHLRRVVMATGRASLVRAAALRAMSLTNFVGASDEVSTEALMDLCEAVAAPKYRGQEVPPNLRASALDCWALLSTTVQDVFISGQSDVHIGRGLHLLELLRDCLLSCGSMDLRFAAGECVAVIHECRWSVGDEDGDNATERRFSRGSWEGSPWEDTMAEIHQRIAELSTESAKRISKKARKEQRATFREFLATISDDEPAPEETISFRGGDLTVRSWREIVQLNFVRQCLQSGFQIQLLTNPTLQAIFGVDGHRLNVSNSMSQLEKRLIMSKTSEAAKAAHRDLTRKRRVRNNIKNHFITADGEDI